MRCGTLASMFEVSQGKQTSSPDIGIAAPPFRDGGCVLNGGLGRTTPTCITGLSVN